MRLVTRPILGGVDEIERIFHSRIVDEVAVCLPATAAHLVVIPQSAVFDIMNLGDVDKNIGYLISAGTLYTLDIKTGAATKQGPVKGAPANLVDIAVFKK